MTLSIFVAHPSALLTDYLPHGDGLVAHGFLRGLAEQGHVLHVAVQHVELEHPLPANVVLHHLGSSRLPRPLGRLDYMLRLRRLFNELRRTVPFDLVHQLNPVDVGLTLALPDVGVPVVLGPYVPAWPPEGHGVSWVGDRLLDLIKATIRALQQQRATAVLLSTPAAATQLRRRSSEKFLVRELSPGIDQRHWSPSDGETKGPEVLFVGSLERRKGIFVLLEAFARLADELPEARLLVAGDGSQADAVRRWMTRFPAANRVDLVGPVPRERLPGLMGACAVFCVPSLIEPFGMSALEAMACGKPLVVTDAGGLRHLVDQRGGQRVPPGDSKALAQALRELLTAPQRRREMGQHNRRIVEERFGWDRVIRQLEEVYRDAAAAVGRR